MEKGYGSKLSGWNSRIRLGSMRLWVIAMFIAALLIPPGMTAKANGAGGTAPAPLSAGGNFPVLFEDTADNMQAAGWTLSRSPEDGVYVTDSANSLGNPNLISMKPVEPGQYLFYGDKAASEAARYTMMSKTVPIGSGEWTLEFSARFADLIKPKLYPAERGILFVVYANEKRYQISFNDKNKLYGLTSASGTVFVQREIDMPQDNAFHQWAITFDGLETVSVKLDGIKIAAFQGLALPAAGRLDSVVVGNLPLDWVAGKNEVYFDHFKLFKGDPDVHMQDAADNLAQAGWTRNLPPVNGLYITDSENSLGNPNGIGMKPVEQGEYLFYGDKAASDAGKYAYIGKNMTIGSGAWALEFSAKFAQLMTPSRYLAERGVVFDFRANQKRYKIAFNDGNQIVAQVGSGNAVDARRVTMPDDGQFHQWKISYDGQQAVSVSMDGTVVARFEQIAGTVNTADGLFIYNTPLDWQAGVNEVYFDSIRFTQEVLGNPNVLIDDDGAGFPTMNWQANAPIAGAYFTDFRQTNGAAAGMKTAETGTYLTYAEAGSGQAAQLSKKVAIGNAPWALEFDAKIKSLASPSGTDVSKGLGFEVAAGGVVYRAIWNDGNKLRLLKNDGSYETVTMNMPSDQLYHTWGLAYNGRQVIVTLDGAKLGVWQGLGLQQAGPDQIRVINDASGAATGNTEAVIDRLRLAKNELPPWSKFEPMITGISVLPTSSQAEGIETVVSLFDADPLSFQDGSLQVEASLLQGGQTILTKLQAATGSNVPLHLDGIGASGRMTMLLRLLKDGAEITKVERNLEVYPSVSVLAPGQQATAQPGEVILFTDMEKMWDETLGAPLTPTVSGWEKASYRYEGASSDGVFLENFGDTHTLSLPASLNGWFGVYIGYVTGSEQIAVSDGVQDHTVSTGENVVFNPGQAYGSKAIGEVFAFASDFPNHKLILKRVPGKQARIAYVKLKGLTADEVSLYNQADEGEQGKRVIYNNDGYSDFTSGLYANEQQLKAKAVDIYAGKDVGSLYWALGTTMAIFRDSPTALKPYTNLTPEQEALMRTSDKMGRDMILQLINSGKDPLEIVAGRAKQIGVNTFASLRMNAFYNHGEYPFLNGPRYEEFMQKNYLQLGNDGTKTIRMSYAYPEFREFVKNVLVEAAFVTNGQGEQVVSGVELDFGRYPNLFGYETTALPKADMMTGFLRELRSALAGKQIAVRVPYYQVNDIDLETWVSEGLIDILIPSSVGHEEFNSNLAYFANLVSNTGVKLYGGVTGTLSGHEMTKVEEDLKKRGIPITAGFNYVSKQQYLLRAYQFYEAGYDGIYIFNNWRGDFGGQRILGELGDKVKAEKWYTFAYPAEWTQNIVTTQGTPRSLLFYDDAASMKTAGWNVNTPQTGAYLTDSANTMGNPSGLAMKPVPAGQYLVYGDETSAGKYVTMTKSFTIGAGPWKWQFDAKFADLITPSANLPDRGVIFRMNANGQKFILALNSYDAANHTAKAVFRGDKLYRNIGTYTIPMPADNAFHAWEIRFDGQTTVSLWMDGTKLAEYAGFNFPDPTADSIEISSIPLQAVSGTNEVYIDNIRFSKIIAPTSLELDPAAFELGIGQSRQLNALFTPTHATERTVTWSTYDPAIATVDANGLVTALSAGVTQITARTVAGGLTATSTVTVEQPDIAPPTTDAAIAGTAGAGDWYTSDVTVSLQASDNGSGVASTEYALTVIQSVYGMQSTDGFIPYDSPIVLGDGIYQIQYRSTDRAGNVEAVHSVTVKSDKAAPAFTVSANGYPLMEGAVFEDGEPITFEWQSTDSLSGIAVEAAVVDGTPYVSGTQLNWAGRLGTHILLVSVTDQAGNTSQKAINVSVTTSGQSMQLLLSGFSAIGDVAGPLQNQLSNSLAQALDHFAKGHKTQAVKHMQDFLKHMNKAKQGSLSDEAKQIFTTDANALIEAWSNYGGILP
ncbi:FIMAH domain-containing protein [Paenibacillus contaminans]|uniref:BIG2 domain-containing protein n=1 Tax=Paenibacillus contaminans TaxID=450362 RepID=A0A329LSJ3_9BACL|nr:Ig-like domain-containing protein [Paenibacillus contaminans]RAV10905.1 hypothetical protein DQG23_36940 [Paenibacillus contaminans]